MLYHKKLLDTVKNPYELNEQTLNALQKLARDYPYCQTIQILLAKNLEPFDKLAFEKQVNKASAYAVDRRKFQRYISERDRFVDEAVVEKPETVDTIENIELIKEIETAEGLGETDGVELVDQIDREESIEQVEQVNDDNRFEESEEDETVKVVEDIDGEKPAEIVAGVEEFDKSGEAEEVDEVEQAEVTDLDIETSEVEEQESIEEKAAVLQPETEKNTSPYQAGFFSFLKRKLFGTRDERMSDVEPAPVNQTTQDAPAETVEKDLAEEIHSKETVAEEKEEIVLDSSEANLQDTAVSDEQNESAHVANEPQSTKDSLGLSGFGVPPAVEVDRQEDAEDQDNDQNRNVEVAAESNSPFTLHEKQAQKSDINFLIEKFLKEEPRIKPRKDLPETQEDLSAQSANEDPMLVSETLAKVFLKQGKNAKALDIYEKLCLKYPEKSSYFAKKILAIKNEINT